jgi:hypothetical protein
MEAGVLRGEVRASAHSMGGSQISGYRWAASEISYTCLHLIGYFQSSWNFYRGNDFFQYGKQFVEVHY